jgi:four helix bundle protein
MSSIERFEEIEAWKRARELTNRVYDAFNAGQFANDFALRDQIRRSVISITSNIAEGFERGGDQEFIQFLAIAKASCAETRSQLYVALDQNYINKATFQRLSGDTEAIGRLIAGFIKYLQKSPMRGNKYK